MQAGLSFSGRIRRGGPVLLGFHPARRQRHLPCPASLQVAAALPVGRAKALTCVRLGHLAATGRRLLPPFQPRHVRLHQLALLLAHTVLRCRLAGLPMDELLTMGSGMYKGKHE